MHHAVADMEAGSSAVFGGLSFDVQLWTFGADPAVGFGQIRANVCTTTVQLISGPLFSVLDHLGSQFRAARHFYKHPADRIPRPIKF